MVHTCCLRGRLRGETLVGRTLTLRERDGTARVKAALGYRRSGIVWIGRLSPYHLVGG